MVFVARESLARRGIRCKRESRTAWYSLQERVSHGVVFVARESLARRGIRCKRESRTAWYSLPCDGARLTVRQVCTVCESEAPRGKVKELSSCSPVS